MSASSARQPAWAYACTVDEVPEAGALRVEFGDTPVAIVKSDGDVYAIFDICSHAEVSLSEGEVDGTTIECWLHGSRFDLTTGRPTGLPATRPVPVYPTKIEGDAIYVAVQES
jgi:3-phenylpropionate/trans-cinnamate dioxygenase ferredoxin subunit